MERRMIVTEFSTYRKRIQDGLHKLFEDLESIESEIMECIEELKLVDFEVKRITRCRNRRRDFVNSIEERMDEVAREIAGIRESYAKYGEVLYSDDEDEELERLTMERVRLQKFHDEVKVIADTYNERLSGIKEKATVHKKERLSDECEKLKVLSEMDFVPSNLVDAIDDLIYKLGG